jgi:hypothetical protein
MILPGHRTAGLKKELGRYIPIAATFGGMCVGILTVLADFMGVIGSGNFILVKKFRNRYIACCQHHLWVFRVVEERKGTRNLGILLKKT